MKLENLLEAPGQKRWPKAPGREIPLKTEHIIWLNNYAIPYKDDRYGSEDIGFNSKWYWLDETTGDVVAHPDITLIFVKSNLPTPPFKFESVGGFTFDGPCKIDDFSWFPKRFEIRLNFNQANIQSLKGLSKRVEFVKVFTFPVKLCKNLLEVYSIRSLEKITNIASNKIDLNTWRTLNMIREYFNSGKDPFDCQEELISKGFGDYA